MQKPPVDSNSAAKARALRFKREARAGPPPLPKREFAHPGGKIETSDKEECLRKLLERKARRGEALTADQVRAAEAHGGAMAALPLQATTNVRPAPPPPKQAPAAPPASKEARKLRKRLHEIMELERRVREGAVLEANQQAKLASKQQVAAQLEALAR